MKLAEHVTRICYKRSAYRALVGKPEENSLENVFLFGRILSRLRGLGLDSSGSGLGQMWTVMKAVISQVHKMR
jgi:hypothetical protein